MPQEQRFFCLRGFMKSGTNWTGRLLNLHPDIHCIGEFHWETYFQTLQNNLASIAPKRRPKVQTVVRREVEEMVRRSLIAFARHGTKLIGDRTPSTIHPVVLRNAPHICVIRDCRDVVVSRMFHLYNVPRVTRVFQNFPEMGHRLEQFQADPWFFRDNPLELLAHEGIVRGSARDWVKFLQADRNTMLKLPNLRVAIVRYENLHADVERERKNLYEFLNVAPAVASKIPAPLQPGHAQEKPNEFNRKGIVGDWQNYMTDQAKVWIKEEAGQELIQQGYADSLDW